MGCCKQEGDKDEDEDDEDAKHVTSIDQGAKDLNNIDMITKGKID